MLSYAEISKECLRIAKKLHGDQRRRGGEPYINHCIRVGESFPEDSICRCIGYLHDIYEDTDVDEREFSAIGDSFFVTVIRPLVLKLTHCKGDSYSEYIRKLMQGPSGGVAKQVKAADIVDNLTGSPTPRQIEKYRKALIQLVS